MISKKTLAGALPALAAALVTVCLLSGCGRDETTAAQRANGVTPAHLEALRRQESRQEEILRRHRAARAEFEATKSAEAKARMDAIQKEYEACRLETEALVRERLKRAAKSETGK